MIEQKQIKNFSITDHDNIESIKKLKSLIKTVLNLFRVLNYQHFMIILMKILNI